MFNEIKNRLITIKWVNKSLALMKKSRFFRYELPFLSMILGGVWFAKQFRDAEKKYKELESGTIDFNLFREKGIDVKREGINLEEEYEKIKKENELHEWSNIRGPRAWEDNAEWEKTLEAADTKLSEEMKRERLKKEEITAERRKQKEEQINAEIEKLKKKVLMSSRE